MGRRRGRSGGPSPCALPPSLRFNEFLCFPENSTAGSCPNFRNFSSVSPLSSLDLPGTGWSDAWFMKGFWADILHQVCSRSRSRPPCTRYAADLDPDPPAPGIQQI